MNNFISIDFGTKKSWLAYSVGDFCFSWKTVPTSQIFEILENFIREKSAEKIILGMPYNIDGTISPHARRVKIFSKKLEKFFPNLPVVLFDERLSTAQAKMDAEENFTEFDIDAESARIILENFINSQKEKF